MDHFARRVLIRLTALIVAVPLYVGYRAWQNRPSEFSRWVSDSQAQMRPLIREYGELVPARLPPMDVGSVKGRKVLFAENGNASLVWISGDDWKAKPALPTSIAASPQEVGVIVFLSHRSNGIVTSYENGATATGKIYSLVAISVPDKRAIAQWERRAFPPAVIYGGGRSQRGNIDHTFSLDMDKMRRDADALFAGELPLGAKPSESFVQKEEAESEDVGMIQLTAAGAANRSDLAEAERLHKRAIALLEGRSPQDKPRLANALKQLASVMAEQKKHADAAELLDRARSIEGDVPHESETLRALGEQRLLAGNTRAATLALKQALKNDESESHAGSIQQGRILNLLAEAAVRENLLAEADGYSRRALAMLETALDLDSPEVVRAFELRTSVLERRGRHGEAKKLAAARKSQLEAVE